LDGINKINKMGIGGRLDGMTELTEFGRKEEKKEGAK
jgi:hypothetical protein